MSPATNYLMNVHSIRSSRRTRVTQTQSPLQIAVHAGLQVIHLRAWSSQTCVGVSLQYASLILVYTLLIDNALEYLYEYG